MPASPMPEGQGVRAGAGAALTGRALNDVLPEGIAVGGGPVGFALLRVGQGFYVGGSARYLVLAAADLPRENPLGGVLAASVEGRWIFEDVPWLRIGASLEGEVLGTLFMLEPGFPGPVALAAGMPVAGRLSDAFWLYSHPQVGFTPSEVTFYADTAVPWLFTRVPVGLEWRPWRNGSLLVEAGLEGPLVPSAYLGAAAELRF